MPAYLEYLLKTSLCLAIIYLFYIILLKRSTYYTWNRYFLLSFQVLSFLVPVINLHAFVQQSELPNYAFVSQIPALSTHALQAISPAITGFNYWQLASGVFIIVAAALLLRLSIQLASIEKLKLNARLLIHSDVKVYQLSGATLPFSFLNNIFINTNNYQENELQEIIEHEQVHVQQKHSVDVLITELICIANWYNPFAWLIRKAVRENLEFIADNEVIRKGVDKKNYQYLLLKVTGATPLSITSSLTYSSLKSRIRMMNKTKTSGFHLLKFLLMLPVIAVVLLAFRNENETTSQQEKTDNAETYTLSSITYSIADAKVKSIVIAGKDQSFLKQGELLNLTLIANEKKRLKTLLEKNGYQNLKSNAIKFMIDTASVDNSFSVEVNINAEPAMVRVRRRQLNSPGSVAFVNQSLQVEKAFGLLTTSRKSLFSTVSLYPSTGYEKTHS